MTKGNEQIIVGNTPIMIDWKKLRKQRGLLAALTADGCKCRLGAQAEGMSLSKAEDEILDMLEGLQGFLDAFVDASAGVLGEKVVFGRKLS